MLARDPLLPFAVLSSMATSENWISVSAFSHRRIYSPSPPLYFPSVLGQLLGLPLQPGSAWGPGAGSALRKVYCDEKPRMNV